MVRIGEPLISVVMPVYNGQATVQSALESILAQTVEDFEFIIVDDQSDDGTLEVIGACADPRVRVLRNLGEKGISPALNVGLGAATGRYIARMDCDDLCAPNRFERQVAFLEGHGDVGVCGTFQEIFGGHRDGLNPTAVTDAEIRVRLMGWPTMLHSTVMFRTSVFRDNHLLYDPSFKYCEDYELWVRASKVTKLYNLPEYLCRYRVEGERRWASDLPVMMAGLDLIWSRQLGELGLVMGRRDLDLYRILIGRGTFTDYRDLFESREILKKILGANRRRKLYDGPCLSRQLLGIWRTACRSLARRSAGALAAYGASFLAPSAMWAP